MSNALYDLAQVSSIVLRSIEEGHSSGVYFTGNIKTRYTELRSLLQRAQEDANYVRQCLRRRHDLLETLGVTLDKWQHLVRKWKKHVAEALRIIDELGPGILKARWNELDNRAVKAYALLRRVLGLAQMSDESDMYFIWKSLPEHMKSVFLEDMEGIWKCISALKEAEAALSALDSTIGKLLSKVGRAGIRNREMATQISIEMSLAVVDYNLQKL